MNNKKCLGCGIELQSDDEKKLGYVPYDKLLLEEDILCKRCFRLKHYGENNIDYVPKGFYKSQVEKAIKKSDIVLAVIDIFDLETSFNDEILDILRDNTSFVVINKIDLLPRDISKNKLVEYVRNRFNDEEIFLQELSFVSAKSLDGIKGIMKKIVDYATFQNKKDINVCIIGVSNTGKSSIIKLMTSNYGIKLKNVVSKYSGTTIKNMSVKLKVKGININLIDTPGLIPEGRLIELVDEKTSIELVPINRLIPRKINMKKDDVLMLSNYFSIEKLDSNINSKGYENATTVMIYASPKVKEHLTNNIKYLELQSRKYLNITEEESLKVKEEYVNYDVKLSKRNNHNEISIPGLGFITIIGEGNFRIRYLKEQRVIIRPEMLWFVWK